MNYLAIGYVIYAANYVIAQTLDPAISVTFVGWQGLLIRVALLSTAGGVIWKMWLKPVVKWARGLGITFEAMALEIHNATAKILDLEARVERLEHDDAASDEPPILPVRRA